MVRDRVIAHRDGKDCDRHSRECQRGPTRAPRSARILGENRPEQQVGGEEQQGLPRERTETQGEARAKPARRRRRFVGPLRGEHQQQNERNHQVRGCEHAAKKNRRRIRGDHRARNQRHTSIEEPPTHRHDQRAAERAEQSVRDHRGFDSGPEDRVDQAQKIRVEGREREDALPQPIAARNLDRPLVIEARVGRRKLEEGIVEPNLSQMQEAQREGESEDRPRSNLLSARPG